MKNIHVLESGNALCALRRKIAAIETSSVAKTSTPLGYAGLDAAIGGGLVRGCLHELYAAEPDDSGAAAGFTALLACRVSQADAPLFWLREELAERREHLHPSGLAEIGVDPERITLIVPPDPVALLRAAADVVRCAGAGAVVIEFQRCPRALDLTASRRLALAAEASGVTALLLQAEAKPSPSAAQTRWSIHAGPSMALEAGAPGRPAFIVELLRQRGRPDGGSWHLEWDRDRSCFSGSTLSGAVVSSATGGSLESGPQRRAG